MLLRPAAATDPDELAEIAALFTASRAAAVPLMPPARHTPAEDRAFFAARVADPVTETWVAEDDGTVVGFVLLTPTWLDHLYVHPDRQGEGIGTALLQLAQALRPEGFGLWVFESNAPARALYRAHGLVEVEWTDGSGNEEQAPDVKMLWEPGDQDCRRGMPGSDRG